MKSPSVRALVGLAVACALAAIVILIGQERGRTGVPTLTYEELTGSVFTSVVGDPFRVPKVQILQAPDFPGAVSIWGSTGRDRRGHIWFGFSACCGGDSARLYEFDPQNEVWRDHGSVIDHLKAAGLYRQGEKQIVIHSRIVPAPDGRLYFVSTDSEGEKEDGSVLPRWGGHLWSIDPETGKWWHLMAVPEGLIATAGVGRFVYALGYWNHILFQYDTVSGAIRRSEIGSVGGHISRNFISDIRGHVFVPRVRRETDGSLSASLVELDSELRERAVTPLDAYLGRGTPENNQGITGLAYLRDGRIVFVTSRGFLYALDNPKTPDEPRGVRAVGWMHPQGEAYTASLYSLGDNATIAAIFARPGGYEWTVMDLRAGTSAAFPIDTKELKDVLLYGSIARDNSGRAYAVGWYSIPRGKGPLVLQIDP